jgi:hypothetical protein
VPNGLRIKIFLLLPRDGFVTEPEGHDISIFQPQIAPLIDGTHGHRCNLGLSFCDQVAGRFKLFEVRGKIQPQDFSLLGKRQQDGVLSQDCEILNVSLFGLALAYYLCLVDVHEVNVSRACTDYQSVPLGLVAEGRHGGLRVHLL